MTAKFARSGAVLLCSLAVLTTSAFAQNAKEITQKDAISGKMFINFSTKKELDTSGDLKEGSPKLGVRDTYYFTFNVLNKVEFDGKIARLPNLYSKTLGRRKQDAMFDYEKLDINVMNPANPAQKKTVGRWTGMVPIDTESGAYLMAGDKEHPLRIFVEPIGRAPQVDEKFGGKLIGKASEKSSLASQTYKRVFGTKTVEYTATKIDPMKFDNLVLAMGPVSTYPTTVVNGRLDYDYETGNWITEGLTFKYSLDGVETTDIVTGTIKWVEAKGADKAYYEFNLRFNEEKHKPAAGVEAAFAPPEGLDAFFAVDNNIPALTGRATYDDKKGEGDKTVESGSIYNLDANKLTEQQLMYFMKLWIIASGPINDD